MLESKDLEEVIVGACLISQQDYWKISETLSPRMFSTKWLRAAFSIISELAETSGSWDITLVARRLSDISDDDMRSRLLIAADKAGQVEAGAVARYASEIVDAYQRRRLRGLADRLLKECRDSNRAPGDIIAEADAEVRDISGADSSSERTLHQLAVSAYDDVERSFRDGKPTGLLTGIHAVDELLGRIQSTDFIVFGGASQIGKTAIATQIAMNVSREVPVDFFALDQAPRDIAQRVMASRAGVPVGRLRSGDIDEATAVRLATDLHEIARHDVRMIRQPSMTMRDIRMRAMSAVRTRGVGLIVIDHLKRISLPRRVPNRIEGIAQVVDQLKELTLEIGVPVIVLSQRTRGSQRDDSHPEPRVTDLYGGGDVEELADMILLAWRPDLNEAFMRKRHDEDEISYDARRQFYEGKLELILGKHRSAQPGAKQWPRFDGSTMRILEEER